MARTAERVSRARWLPPWTRRQHVARYAWAQPLVTGLDVLDGACGTGYGSVMLASAARHVTGVDAAAAAIAEARGAPGPKNVAYCLADLTALPFAARTFDAYVSFETIEHVARDDLFLEEAARVLRPGGLFLCSTPNREVTNPGTRLGDAPFNPHHVREYDEQELAERLRARFASLTLLGQSTSTRRWASWLRAAASASPRLAVRVHQLRKLAGAPFDRPERHVPRLMPPGERPEFFVTICRR